MSLTAGTRIGSYEILSSLGAGGMGEVYRARDSKLKREVAIKVLPPDVANDRERLARFQREAEVLASLNHPHIAQIYGIEDGTPEGVPYERFSALIMELVEGEDLSQRIARGPIPIDDAMPIARQIVDALECAHEAGVIHRDLKPANIKVRPDGTVKVLDFGLAKALDPGSGLRAPGSGSLANSPTITSPAMTMHGMILGTAAYMSPEQAKGRIVDKRADIWAFGCVLYEMLTARRAFQGEDATDTIAEVLKSAVKYDALPPSTPASVRRVIARCLERDPKMRLRDIGDARIELAADTRDAVAPPQRSHGLSYAAAAALVAAAVVISAGAAWALKDREDSAPRPVIRATWSLGTGYRIRLGLQRQQVAISHNGMTVAALGTSLMVRKLDDPAWTTLPSTQEMTGVFGSPDGQWLGSITRRDIGKMRVSGGPRTVIAQLANTSNLGAQSAVWADDNRIYFTDGLGIHAVPADGGAVYTLFTGVEYTSVAVLPGSRALVVSQGFAQADPSIVLKSLDGGADVVLANGLTPRFIAPDLLFYVRAGTLLGARLDIAGRRLVGEPVALVEQVATLSTSAQFDISNDGTLIYVAATSTSEGHATLQLKTPRGTLEPLSDTVRAYSDPRLSPDGRQLALHLYDQDNDIWIFDMARGAMSRLTFDPREDETPAWSPDGRWIAYAGYVPGGGADRAVLRRRADGSGAEEVLMKGPTHSHVTDWTPDGRSLLIESAEVERRSDIVMVNVADRTVTSLIATPFSESAARISPDGKWMAYQSDESGRLEVYLRSFPGLEAKVQVSTGGGEQPVWSRDGKWVYFRTATDIARSAMVPSGAAMQVGSPATLFADNFLRPQAVNHTTYEVLPDGRVLVFDVTDDAAARATAVEIIGVFNWLDEVRRKVTRQ
jgi:serine/threonine protein kinase/WD40 repeat protein